MGYELHWLHHRWEPAVSARRELRAGVHEWRAMSTSERTARTRHTDIPPRRQVFNGFMIAGVVLLLIGMFR